MNDIILETHSLTKRFRGQTAVNGVSLRVPYRGIYGLLGQNGAGKSTLLKLVTGILRPEAGEIIFDGHPWDRKDLRKIGALIETPALYGNLTAAENLEVHTRVLGLPKSRIAEVLEIVGLRDTGRKRTAHFSLGMKQRLGIAIALLNKPRLLILDEPTNGLDPLGIQELRELLRSFANQGMTVMISSHILAEVEQVVDHVGIINEGRLVYEGALKPGISLETLFLRIVGGDRKEQRHA